MHIVNLTYRDLRLKLTNGTIVDFPKSGRVAHVKRDYVVSTIDIGPVFIESAELGATKNLPEPEPDTLFIVSGLVRVANPDRVDILSPGKFMPGTTKADNTYLGLIANV